MWSKILLTSRPAPFKRCLQAKLPGKETSASHKNKLTLPFVRADAATQALGNFETSSATDLWPLHGKPLPMRLRRCSASFLESVLVLIATLSHEADSSSSNWVEDVCRAVECGPKRPCVWAFSWTLSLESKKLLSEHVISCSSISTGEMTHSTKTVIDWIQWSTSVLRSMELCWQSKEKVLGLSEPFKYQDLH